MKKHQLILVSSLIFTMLFYKQTMGLNLSLFGLALTTMVCYFFKDRFTSKTDFVLAGTSILSCIAFAWYGDFSSFCALILSLMFLQLKIQDPQLKTLLAIPIFCSSVFTSLITIFFFDKWLPKPKTAHLGKKIIAFCLIPLLFVLVFYIVYSFGSNHFSEFFSSFSIDFQFIDFMFMASLGLYLSFLFWNYYIPDIVRDCNPKLNNDFSSSQMEIKPTFSFLDVDFERKSGEISLFLLNIMLLIFIVTYNYEQFFQTSGYSELGGETLSVETHQRVNSVIVSILMAVGVMMFYFKDGFNFDPKAKRLKMLAKIWIGFNGLLIISALLKNVEYVNFYGLTYKRLGVFAFLLLAIIGLILTFIKISKQKTNAYLFNQMIWYAYGTILLCSFINWGNLITSYNISVNKGVEASFLMNLNFNEKQWIDYLPKEDYENYTDHWQYIMNCTDNKNKPFLSKKLYYEMLDCTK